MDLRTGAAITRTGREVDALADELRQECSASTDAGFILQLEYAVLNPQEHPAEIQAGCERRRTRQGDGARHRDRQPRALGHSCNPSAMTTAGAATTGRTLLMSRCANLRTCCSKSTRRAYGGEGANPRATSARAGNARPRAAR